MCFPVFTHSPFHIIMCELNTDTSHTTHAVVRVHATTAKAPSAGYKLSRVPRARAGAGLSRSVRSSESSRARGGSRCVCFVFAYLQGRHVNGMEMKTEYTTREQRDTLGSATYDVPATRVPAASQSVLCAGHNTAISHVACHAASIIVACLWS